MYQKRLEKPRSSAAVAELHGLERASSVLSRANVRDDYQLGMLHTVLVGTYGRRLALAYDAMQQAKRMVDSPAVHNYLVAAESAHVDKWFSEYDQDALVLTRYLAIRPGVVSDATCGRITALTVEASVNQIPQMLCIAGGVALRGCDVDVIFSPDHLLIDERRILASDSEL